MPSLIRAKQFRLLQVRPSLAFPFFLPPYPRRFCIFVSLFCFTLIRVMVSICLAPGVHISLELTLFNTGDVKHTVLQVRLRRSLHRDTLFASGRKVSMGAHLYRRTRRRHTTTDAKIAFDFDFDFNFEADISSWRLQHHTARVACVCCACPAKRHGQSPRGSPVVGLLQNRSVRWRLEQERV